MFVRTSYGSSLKKIQISKTYFSILFYLKSKTWDTRNPAKYDKKFNVQLRDVHLDWHPEEKYWLATASTDKQMNVK
jgi:hypothetical protein